jgi:hypothetical protein
VEEGNELATHPGLLTPIHGIVEDPQVAVLVLDLDAAGLVIIAMCSSHRIPYHLVAGTGAWVGRDAEHNRNKADLPPDGPHNALCRAKQSPLSVCLSACRSTTSCFFFSALSRFERTKTQRQRCTTSERRQALPPRNEARVGFNDALSQQPQDEKSTPPP